MQAVNGSEKDYLSASRNPGAMETPKATLDEEAASDLSVNTRDARY